MHLTLTLPTRIEVDCQAESICAEGLEGNFCIEPRHVDIACLLRPGLLSFRPADGDEDEDIFLAVDGGVLVKVGHEVRVSSPRAVRGELGELTDAIEQQFLRRTEQQQTARSAVQRIQADFVRQYIQLERRG